MIRIDQLDLRQGDFSLEEISLVIPEGSYGALVGKSGCGKTTILEAVCGLRRTTEGKIFLGEIDSTSLPPGERGVGYVPQDGALFPDLTVAEQLAFGLRLRKIEADQMAKRVEELAERLGIENLLGRMPTGLSGGERQRVALGRALSTKPRFLCLDEPLSALDEELHEEMCRLIERIHKETGVTILHVTHSPSEAKRLAGCHFRMTGGKVERDES